MPIGLVCVIVRREVGTGNRRGNALNEIMLKEHVACDSGPILVSASIFNTSIGNGIADPYRSISDQDWLGAIIPSKILRARSARFFQGLAEF